MSISRFAACALAAAAVSLPAASRSAPPAVHIRNFAFVPSRLTVSAGSTVTFINDDDEAHTVTARDKSFDSEGLDGHERWTHVFAQSGSFAYFCELHPMMKAVIVVAAGAHR